jgi:drug/metabolite transporter (DMT)-like permease
MQDLLSISSVLSSLYPVITVLMARVFLGERLAGIQGAGVVIALAGTTLIAAR